MRMGVFKHLKKNSKKITLFFESFKRAGHNHWSISGLSKGFVDVR